MTVRVSVIGLPESNPRQYNDEAFMEASNQFQFAAGEGLEALWKAGASARMIESEIAGAIESVNAAEVAAEVEGDAS